jgi:predicted nucleic acid-binding protein
VIAWLRAHEAEIAVDPVIVGELRCGILLQRWFDAGAERLQCVPWDLDIGLKWAELLAHLPSSGKAMPVKDSLIAATAIMHGLTMVTRNRTDFEKAGVPIVDPFGG